MHKPACSASSSVVCRMVEINLYPRMRVYIYYIYTYIYTVHAVKKLTFYGRTTPTATGVRRLRLRAYYDNGYGRTTPTATGVLRLRLRAY